MVKSELKRLRRRELVDVIYQLKKNEQQLQAQIAELEQALQDRRIRLSSAGSIADAAISITNVLSTAQMTADLYLHEISCMKADTEKECTMMIEDAKQKANTFLEDGKKQYEALAARYRTDYKKWQQLRAEIDKMEQAASDE